MVAPPLVTGISRPDATRLIRATGGELLAVVRTAHTLGIPTTSTIMYGHMETALDRARHLELLRGLQKEARQRKRIGITEFVPLSFIAAEAPMVKKSLVPDVRTVVTRKDVLRMYAVARLMSARWRQRLRRDTDERKHSSSAGAPHGQFLHPVELRAGFGQRGEYRCSGPRHIGSYAALIAAPEFRFRDRR